MLFPILEPSSLLVVVAQPDERQANKIASALEWYDRTEHRTTSCSNKEEQLFRLSSNVTPAESSVTESTPYFFFHIQVVFYSQ